jgi:outer membrane lipoprotein-sorting protein
MAKIKMSKKIMKAFLILSVMAANCWAGGCSAPPDLQGCKKAKPDPVDNVLKQLREKTAELKSYQCFVEYEVNQPTFESRTLRKGVLYYKKKAGKDSALRINFATFKQDDEKDYEFKGIWLAHIDHQLKTVQCHQLAEPNDPNEPADANKPTDPFDLVTQNFPIVGFTRVEDLKREFEIKLVVHEQTEPLPYIHLHLKVKPDSVYKDDYTRIDFWVDKKLGLPARIVAVKTTDDANLQGDILQIQFVKPRINKKIDKKVFGIKIPKGFGKPEIFPLKKAR